MTKRNSIAAISWALCLQYYIVQLLAASQFVAPGYSALHNTISDLGNTACGPYGNRFVCSPLHVVMNFSFIALGVSMFVGAVALYDQGRTMAIKTGLSLFMLAALGTVLVGLFPENTRASMHVLGAGLPFVLGNIGLIIFGVAARRQPVALRTVSWLMGSLGSVALILFVSHNYGPLGSGGMERLAAYPQSLWMIGVGAYLLRHRNHKVKRRSERARVGEISE